MNTLQKPQNIELDIAPVAVDILKTVLLLERKYSASYIVRLLKGESRFPLRKEEHGQLETFSSHEAISFMRLTDYIYFLIDLGYLAINNPLYGTLELTTTGRGWLDKNEPLMIDRKQVHSGWCEVQLGIQLKDLRRTTAEQTGNPPYEVFNNHSLELLVRQKPQTENGLKAIPGMKQLSDSLRLMILAAITDMAEKKAKDEQTGMYAKAYSPRARKIKELHEAGFDPEEIGRRQGVDSAEVYNTLESLHIAGELDLRPWIESAVDPKDLHRAATYFKEVNSPKLNDARDVLGMEYKTLQLCRMYVSQVGEPEIEYAA
jgi:hypothetical protein